MILGDGTFLFPVEDCTERSGKRKRTFEWIGRNDCGVRDWEHEETRVRQWRTLETEGDGFGRDGRFWVTFRWRTEGTEPGSEDGREVLCGNGTYRRHSGRSAGGGSSSVCDTLTLCTTLGLAGRSYSSRLYTVNDRRYFIYKGGPD